MSPSVSMPRWVRFLYTHNPFYLLGTLLILFGLQQCLGSDARVATSGLLPALIAAYTLLLAGIAVLVIRYGQVWDDARTILLVIVLLFFMLSASLDFHVAFDPFSGTLLILAVLAFALVVCEGLLRLLSIHLAPQYKRPFYLLLTLLFLFPAVPAWLTRFQLEHVLPWAMFAFPGLVGGALLTLLPAARTRKRREPASGTPWPWPYYPWSLFVFLTVGAAIRAWWFTISFEPLSGPQSYFRPYFLLPICLAWSALVLEMGRVRRSRGTVWAGIVLPLAGLAAAFPGQPHHDIESVFVARLSDVAGSPAQLTVWGLLLFYGWAWLQNVKPSEGFLIGLGLIAALVDRDTLSLSTLSAPQPFPVACVALGLIAMAICKQSTWRALAGGGMAATGLAYLGFSGHQSDAAWFWQWHAPVLGLLALTVVFDDRLARMLREVAWRAGPGLALAAVAYPWLLSVSPALVASYLALLLLVSVAMWRRQRGVPRLVAASGTLSANLLAYLQIGYGAMQHTLLGDGLPYLAGGVVAVAIAVLISLLKMGLWQRTRSWLTQFAVVVNEQE